MIDQISSYGSNPLSLLPEPPLHQVWNRDQPWRDAGRDNYRKDT
ncbi:MAG: hypothetical protein XD88_1098, partial [Methanocalculus sp. 52_23]